MTASLRVSLLLAVALISVPAAAKSLWRKVCGKEGCTLEQEIRAPRDKSLILRVRILPDKQPDQIQIHLGAPIGVSLPNGISLSVDGSKQITLPYLRCFGDECGAQAVVSFDALQKLLQGRILSVRYTGLTQQPVDLLVQLDGLDAALQTLGK